jgi:hypothetical protein
MANQFSVVCCLGLAVLLGGTGCQSTQILEQIGLNRGSAGTTLGSLSEEQVITALKQALAVGSQYAVTNLGRPDGFLNNPQVRIPLPQSMRNVENSLRALGQGALADQFVATMNRAAEQAVPEAVEVLGQSLQQMTIADAKNILTGPNTAATDYFRRTSSTNLYTRFLPIVKRATDQTGVTSAYKRLLDKTSVGGIRLGTLGGLGADLDIDSYITQKALDGLFFKIAEQERLIRENPAARSTEILQKVFGVLNSQ